MTDENGRAERFYKVGILDDGTLHNPNGYPDELVRAAVLAADADDHERRSQAARKAAVTRRARTERLVYQAAKQLLAGRRFGPAAKCVICRKGLSDDASIERGIGSECWQDVPAAMTERRRAVAG